MSKILIEAIIKCFEEENRDRTYYEGAKQIDIPFYISVLEQSLNDDKYKELHEDLEKSDWNLVFLDGDGYYVTHKIQIIFEDATIPYLYTIGFEYDDRRFKYCECSKGDPDYDERYDCCGHGCDWDAPKFSINKEIYLGSSSFDGDEHDYWDFKDKFYNIDDKNKKEQKKLARIKVLEEEKIRIEKELAELKNID